MSLSSRTDHVQIARVFASVVLHELGHAIVARRCGLRTMNGVIRRLNVRDGLAGTRTPLATLRRVRQG